MSSEPLHAGLLPSTLTVAARRVLSVGTEVLNCYIAGAHWVLLRALFKGSPVIQWGTSLSEQKQCHLHLALTQAPGKGSCWRRIGAALLGDRRERTTQPWNGLEETFKAT